MDKSELIERFTTQRLALSVFRSNLRDQLKKADAITWTDRKVDYLEFDPMGSNPIVIEVYESQRAANLAFMWLGKALFFLGEKAYTHSYDPSNQVIEPALDVAPYEPKEYANPIEMLKSIRSNFKDMEAQMASNVKIPAGSLQLSIAINNAFTYFEEACMWLGVALGNIRDRKIEGLVWNEMRQVNFQRSRIEDDAVNKTEGPGTADMNPVKGPTSDEGVAALEKKIEADLFPGATTPGKNATITLSPTNEPTNEKETANESGTEGRTETDNSQGGGAAGSDENQMADQNSGGSGDSKADPSSGKNGGREVLSPSSGE